MTQASPRDVAEPSAADSATSAEKLTSEWESSCGVAIDVEMLEYHRSKYRDGTWRKPYEPSPVITRAPETP
jgi:hypothetical protein